MADLDIEVEKRIEPWQVGTHLMLLSEGIPKKLLETVGS